MLIDLEELAGEIASKVDGAGLTPVIEKEIVHYEIIRCYGRVAASLGISDQVEHARRRLATEISSGSISAAGMPKRNLGLS